MNTCMPCSLFPVLPQQQMNAPAEGLGSDYAPYTWATVARWAGLRLLGVIFMGACCFWNNRYVRYDWNSLLRWRLLPPQNSLRFNRRDQRYGAATFEQTLEQTHWNHRWVPFLRFCALPGFAHRIGQFHHRRGSQILLCSII